MTLPRKGIFVTSLRPHHKKPKAKITEIEATGTTSIDVGVPETKIPKESKEVSEKYTLVHIW